jgi:GNAT superfamily N-acetyltransferase
LTRIRCATPGDGDAIDDVLRDVWGQHLERETFASHLSSDECGVWVAEVDQEVAGFVSAFATVDLDERPRWEIDLIAVKRKAQGIGLGKSLLRFAKEGASSRGAAYSRSFVRTDNHASQRIFEAEGFKSDHHIYLLNLWNPKVGDSTGTLPGEVNLIPVDTLTYRGLWIEGLTSGSLEAQKAIVNCARDRVLPEGRLNAGAFVRSENLDRLDEGLKGEANVHGEYYCWVRTEKGRAEAEGKAGSQNAQMPPLAAHRGHRVRQEHRGHRVEPKPEAGSQITQMPPAAAHGGRRGEQEPEAGSQKAQNASCGGSQNVQSC